MLALASRFRAPLLLCNPSLAVALEEAGRPYALLDRDERFAFLSGSVALDRVAVTLSG